MNYAGKLDAAISLDGQGSRSPADGPVGSFVAKAHGHIPEGAFVVPDPNLIFHGEFNRAGSDLVLSHDGREFVVHDYFRGDKRAAIASPDGAHLTGNIVNALTGHVEYAQAAPGAAATQIIGHVTKLAGSATAVRNGVSIILNNGDNVEKGDVVSTGSDSTLGITFIDGTVFGLSSNARMVLNEMVYDPNGSNNSSLLSLVAGTITFVAGETAKHGDMKIDTPVATMGIRGTAVLNQISFIIPPGGGDPQPQVNFQVLVEPDGTTGSYILFDKITLLPIATVNQAGQMIQISGGNVSVTNALMSPDVQKLITDVFTLKFTDNGTNTKLTSNFTDTITQDGNNVLIKTESGATATATFANLNQQQSQSPTNSTGSSTRIPGPPLVQSLDASGNVDSAFSLTERAHSTGDTTPDKIIGRITFFDQNLGDRPTVSMSLADAPNYLYRNSGQQDVTASLSALQKQEIAATQIQIDVAAVAGNSNIGSAFWTYTIPDNVFDFIGAGETLTLTYMVRVDNNFTVSPETKFVPISITITGTNDKPAITTGVPTITFEGGTSVPGGPLASNVPTSGTLSFKDVDLTDTHTVAVKLTSHTLPVGSVPPGPLALFESAMSVAIATGSDSTGSGIGTINWSLADLPVYLADFIPKDEALTLVYTVTVTDSQGATSQQTITVMITGTDAPAVVWVATNHAGAPAGGFWKDAANWETGTVPGINDDVIVITDQLHGLTPSYPVTIDTAAYAKSLTMNDFGGPPPDVINQSSLTIAGALDMSADSIFTNSATGIMSIGGKAEILDTAVFTNAGYLTLASGGDFASGTSIRNSGTIELSGGTLKTLAEIHNAGGALKVNGGTTLIIGTATVDGGSVTIGGTGTVTLADSAAISNSTIANDGTLEIAGVATLLHDVVTNNGTVKVDDGKTLTLSGTEITGGIINNYSSTLGGTIDVAGNSTIDGHATLNKGAITVESGFTLTLDDATVSGTEIANGGTVKVDASKKLTLAGASLTGGALTIAGTLASSGATTITNADITNTGTITVTGGTLTIDPPIAQHTITNSHLIQANGGELDISGELIVNTADLKTINGGMLRLADVTITNGGGTVTVDGSSKLYLSGVSSINDGYLINGGQLFGVSSSNTITAAVANTGTIEVQGGALNLDGGLTGVGTLIIDDKATLELGGADAQTVTFAGGADTLQLDKVAGQSFTGTINGQSSTTGIFTITGAADINTSSGDALDFTASGGTSDNRGDIVLTPTGTLSGANNGIAVTQNGIGKISLTTLGDITGTAGDGVVLHDGITGAGDITVTIGGAASGAVGLDILANGHSDAIVTNNGHITGTTSFGISVVQDGAGATGSTHITNAGSVVGAAGIAAISIQENATGTALIDNSGTIGPDAAHVTSTTSAIFEACGAVTINNTGHIDGNISVATATFNNEAAGTWTVSGTSVFGALSAISNAGEIDLHSGASISGADGLTFAIGNSGEIESWGITSITGAITNTHTIEIHSGALTLFGSLSGSGSVTIDADAMLTLDGTVAQTVTFSGTDAELQINTASFGGSIAGLAATDKLDLSTIEYGLGTSATYISNGAHTGGVLTVTDAHGHGISLTLVGDFSNAHFAGSDDGTGHTLITLNADDDAPKFAAAEVAPSTGFSELAGTTGSPALDPAPAATGTIHFTDVDLTDRPAATIADQAVTWLDTDHTTHLTLTPGEITALGQALTLQQAGNENNGAVGWNYSIADGALDFLGECQTATVVSTVALDDGHNKTDTAQVTVTITGKNDAPAITAENNDSARADLTETNAGQAAHGTLTLSDADATDHVTVAVDHLEIYLGGVLQTDGLGEPSNATLLNYLSVLSGDVLDGTGTHAQFTWDFNSSGQPFDFLAAGHTLSLQYTITADDGHTTAGTAGVVTINIAGSNDAPTLDAATLASVSGDDSNPSGSSVSDLFASKFHDADDGASLKAVAVTAGNATEGQGVWQYEVAGSDQWVDISGVSEANALVLSTATLVRFVPAGGFSGTPGALDVHAIDDTYTGGITTDSPVSIDITNAHGGTTPVSDQATSIGTNVTARANVETAVAPVLSLGPNTTVSPTVGAALKTTLSLHAGDIVSLDWNFTTDDYLPYNDFGFASVNGAAFLLSDIQATGSYGSTGWHTFAYTIPSDGSYTFGAGVMNDRDEAVTSFLAVDNIRVDGAVVQSFENGLGDTSVTGHVAIVTTAQSDVNPTQIVPTDGNHEAFLSSYPTSETSIESFLGLDAGELSNVAKSEGPEHTPINVPITVTIPTNAHPDDTYVTISGAPVGSEFNHGAYDGGTNTWHIEATDLGGNLTLTTPVGYVGNFSLTVTATSVVYGSHTSATTSPETHAVTIDPLAGPEIDTTHFAVSENPDGTTTVLGLSITDADPAAPSETFTVSALTQAAGSSVAPQADVGNLNSVNTILANGITYDPGEDKPAADMVTFKVTDSFGASDTVNFVFKENGSGADDLVGTTGKDVLFATKSSDTLDGNGGQDQFVFAPASASDTIQHTVLGFDTTLDKIDVRQFGNIHSFSDITIVQKLSDTLVTLDDHDTILLKNTVAGNLHASDFIVHA